MNGRVGDMLTDVAMFFACERFGALAAGADAELDVDVVAGTGWLTFALRLGVKAPLWPGLTPALSSPDPLAWVVWLARLAVFLA